MSLIKATTTLRPPGSGKRVTLMNGAAMGTGRWNIGEWEIELGHENFLRVTHALESQLESAAFCGLSWPYDAPDRDIADPWNVGVEMRGHFDRSARHGFIRNLQLLGAVGPVRYHERGPDRWAHRGEPRTLLVAASPFSAIDEITFLRGGGFRIMRLEPIFDW